ncbi:hypothetical protein BV898_10149 [Hypsibius exemplaris]|uniref:E3 ubiquitin-protein ligase APD1-4 middle domain-containing protein n=1 Tax=Hypsibius exemplaris TaxID=2072580 RepID=A0A1W0WKL3_HYPEX|nr:hypothetical protein BV898_10149 [Hypsibius exemplaris]
MGYYRSLSCILTFLWVSGAVVCLFLGIGLRYGMYAWRSHRFMPGEEVILLTGGNQGIFCEKVMLESSGYLTAKHLRIRDWQAFKNPETRIEHFDVALAYKYYDFKKYRLYSREWLDIRVCSERGTMLYTASTQQAFVKLKSDLELGNPCAVDPSSSDPVCGKTVHAYTIPAAPKPCNWLARGQDFNQAMDQMGWRRATFAAADATDVFVVVSSNSLDNRGKNLLEIQSHKLTYMGGTTDIISECLQQQHCMFALDFGSDQAVVLQVGSVTEEPTYPVEIWTICVARDWFFVLLFCIIPVVVLSVVSFFIARRHTATHRLSYAQPTRVGEPLLPFKVSR